MLFVSDFADRRPAIHVDLADLARAEANLRVASLTRKQLYRCTGRARELRTFSWRHFDTVNRRADRNIAKWQRISRLDDSLGPRDNLLTDHQALRCNDVTTLAIRIAKKCDVCAPVRVVFDALHLCWNTILVTTEVNDPIVVLVAAALVTRRDTTEIVPTRSPCLLFNQAGERRALMQIRIYDLYDRAATVCRWFDFD